VGHLKQWSRSSDVCLSRAHVSKTKPDRAIAIALYKQNRKWWPAIRNRSPELPPEVEIWHKCACAMKNRSETAQNVAQAPQFLRQYKKSCLPNSNQYKPDVNMGHFLQTQPDQPKNCEPTQPITVIRHLQRRELATGRSYIEA